MNQYLRDYQHANEDPEDYGSDTVFAVCHACGRGHTVQEILQTAKEE